MPRITRWLHKNQLKLLIFKALWHQRKVLKNRQKWLDKSSPNGVTISDLTDLSLDDAKIIIKNSGLSVGNIDYEDTINDKDAIVYHQAPPPGSILEQGTAVDVNVRKKHSKTV